MAPPSTTKQAQKQGAGGAARAALTTAATAAGATRTKPKAAPRGLARAPTLLARAARLDTSTPWEKDDLLDALFFMRTLAAVACGLGFGLAGVTGGLPALGFGLAAAAGGLAWARSVGVEDDEAYGGQNALLCEGLAPGGMALFLVRVMRERGGRGAWVLSLSRARARSLISHVSSLSLSLFSYPFPHTQLIWIMVHTAKTA